MTLPNFLIIGAWKSATTSLHHYLGQHPDIYTSPGKQTYFFAFEGKDPQCCGPGDEEHHRQRLIIDLMDYQALFQGVAEEKAVGEACSVYLYHPKAPERIKAHIPQATLIAMLRNPVETTYSAYMQQRRDGLEPVADFGQALHLEAERIRNNWRPMWHYKTRGYYYGQLRRYYRLFDASRIHLYLYDDFKKDPLAVVKDIFTRLEVDDSFVPDMTLRYNVGGLPRSKGLQTFLSRKNLVKNTIKFLTPGMLRRRLRPTATSVKTRNLQKPPLDPEIRRQLMSDFSDDILKLQDLIGRDLSRWLQ